MSRSMEWVVWVAVAGATACSHPNPDYDGAVGETMASGRPTAGTGEGSGTGMTTIDPDSGPGDGPEGTTLPTNPTNPTDPTNTTGSTDPTNTTNTTDDSGETDSPMACTIPGLLGIQAPRGSFNGCADNVQIAIEINSSAGGVYDIDWCLGECPCFGGGTSDAISFDHPPPSLDDGECYLLELELVPGMTECIVLAYQISTEAGAPMQLVSNIPHPMDLANGFGLALATDAGPAELCEGGCLDFENGYYALVTDGQPAVLPFAPPVPFDGGTLNVVNLGSGILDSCEPPYFRWVANWPG